MSLSKFYKGSRSFQKESVVRPLATPSPPSTGDGTEATKPPPGPLPASVPSLPAAGGGEGSQEPSSGHAEGPSTEERLAAAYKRGFADGTRKAEEDFGEASRALLHCCRQLDSVRETLIANSRREVIDFAIAVAERIVRVSVREQDRTIIATIDEALQRAIKSDEFVIALNPEDYQTVSARAEELQEGVSGLSSIVLKQDPSVERGGATIESDTCTIDATISAQFDLIRKELQER